MSDAAKNKLLLELFEEWRRSKEDMIQFELIRAALRPLLALEAEKVKDSGVRKEDIDGIIDDLLKDALRAYTTTEVDPITWISARMKNLATRVNRHKLELESRRKK